MEQDRTKFIGGTDANRIMKGDWGLLYREKTKTETPEEKTKRESIKDIYQVKLGKLSESLNLDEFERYSHLKIKKRNVTFKLNWQGVPCIGTADALLEDGRLIEAKHTNHWTTVEKEIEKYKGQMQFYLWISGAEFIFLSLAISNQPPVFRKIGRDNKYINQMKISVYEFWSHVRDKTPPKFDNLHTEPKTEQMSIDDMYERDANKDPHFVERFHILLRTEGEALLHSNAKKDLQNMIGDDERKVYCDLGAVIRTKKQIKIVINKGEQI